MYKPKKSYKNPEFMNSISARPLRILSEYIEPASRFEEHEIENTVVFFGSARTKSEDETYIAAQNFAGKLAEYSRELLEESRKTFYICTGGGPGIMEAANRGACEAGCKTIGLNISLPFEQYPNRYINPELNFEFHYFFTRKLWLLYHAKAIVVYPGGFGTLDELFETLTLIQTEKMNRDKIFILLYNKAYWREIINFDALVKHGTISPEDLDLFIFFDSVEEGINIAKEKLPKILV